MNHKDVLKGCNLLVNSSRSEDDLPVSRSGRKKKGQSKITGRRVFGDSDEESPEEGHECEG